jgi:hypothetical protein
MRSVNAFSEHQKADLKLMCSDVVGPTMLGPVLCLLEQVAFTLAQPDLDPSWIEDQEARDQFEVCMAALEYFRTYLIATE